MLDEAGTLFLNGEPETARMMLRDLVNATVGFEQLAKLTGKPANGPEQSKQVVAAHRSLTADGEYSQERQAPPLSHTANERARRAFDGGAAQQLEREHLRAD